LERKELVMRLHGKRKRQKGSEGRGCIEGKAWNVGGKEARVVANRNDLPERKRKVKQQAPVPRSV